MSVVVRDFVSGRRWWLGVLIAYGLTRLALLPAFWLAWRENSWWPKNYLGQDPTWWALISRGWDGNWYEEIASEGYPDGIPRDPETGLATESAWAFFPAFPIIVRGFMAVTRLPWDIAAPLLAWSFGYIGLCLVFLLVRDGAPSLTKRLPHFPFLTALAIAVFPGSAVLATAYTESLGLLLVSGYLLTLVRQRYWIGLLPIALLGLTRGIALPLMFALLWHIWHRNYGGSALGRRWIPLSVKEWLAAASHVFAIILATVIWPLSVDRITNSPGAYLEIQGTWRKSQFSALPFNSWYAMFDNAVAVTVVLTILVGFTVWWSFSKWTRSFGPELQAWSGAYLGYLIMVVGLNTSVLRFLMLSILLPVSFLRGANSRVAVTLIVGTMFLLQFCYVVFAWSTPGASP